MSHILNRIGRTPLLRRSLQDLQNNSYPTAALYFNRMLHGNSSIGSLYHLPLPLNLGDLSNKRCVHNNPGNLDSNFHKRLEEIREEIYMEKLAEKLTKNVFLTKCHLLN